MLTWIKKRAGLPLLGAGAAALAVVLVAGPAFAASGPAAGWKRKLRPHFDHAPVITGEVRDARRP